MPLQLSVFLPDKSLHLNDTERYRHFCPPLYIKFCPVQNRASILGSV